LAISLYLAPFKRKKGDLLELGSRLLCLVWVVYSGIRVLTGLLLHHLLSWLAVEVTGNKGRTLEMETRRWVSRNSRRVKEMELAGGKNYDAPRQEIIALTVQTVSSTSYLDDKDGSDGHNPALYKQTHVC
jgi:hypothetical protein